MEHRDVLLRLIESHDKQTPKMGNEDKYLRVALKGRPHQRMTLG